MVDLAFQFHAHIVKFQIINWDFQESIFFCENMAYNKLVFENLYFSKFSKKFIIFLNTCNWFIKNIQVNCFIYESAGTIEVILNKAIVNQQTAASDHRLNSSEVLKNPVLMLAKGRSRLFEPKFLKKGDWESGCSLNNFYFSSRGT